MNQREIKFRAWDSKAKEMVYKPVVTSFDWIKGSQGGSHSEIMEFTQLFSWDGKEIFEGDIVKVGKDEALRIIGWLSSKRRFGYLYLTGEPFADFSCTREGIPKENIQIVGNIYENPELLSV